MASSLSVNLKLVSLIESVTCIQDLMPFLNAMFGVSPLTELKEIMKQRLSTMHIQQKHDLYLKASPMDEVLPQCIVEYVIGFNDDLRSIELVNKTFHKCCDSIQRRVLRKKETEWQTEFNKLHSDFKDNRIINVYPSTHHNTLPLAIEHAQSGDTLLIHQGVYQFKEPYTLNKSIKLIGYGPNVFVKASCDDPHKLRAAFYANIVFSAQYAYLQNITFEIEWMMDIVEEVCSFYMENCVMKSEWVALRISKAKTVKIRGCVIHANLIGIDVARFPTKMLQIESCVFENCCRDAEEEDEHCIVLKTGDQKAKFKCVGNHFKNNWRLPIVADNPSKINSETMNNTCCYDQDGEIELFYSEANTNKIYPYQYAYDIITANGRNN
eukprot:409942_1